jgi:hypothetical protein
MAEDDPHAVEGLLIYVYTLEYPGWSNGPKDDKPAASSRSSVRSGKSTVPAARWETHLGLHKIADKICLRRLKAMAKRKLQLVMLEEWTLENFHQLFQQLWRMQQIGVKGLKAAALKVVSAVARSRQVCI